MVSPASEADCAPASVLKGVAETPLPAPAWLLTYQTRPLRVSVTVPVALAGVPTAGESVTVYWKVSVAPVSPGAGVKMKRPSVCIWTRPTAGSAQSNGTLLSVQAPTVIAETAMGSPSTGSLSLASTWPLTWTDGAGLKSCAASTSRTVLPTKSQPSAPAVGASLTGVTVRVNSTASAVSSPLLAVPPLSDRTTVTVADPKAFAAGVKVSVP